MRCGCCASPQDLPHTIGVQLRGLFGFVFPGRWRGQLVQVKRLLSAEQPALDGLGERIDAWLDSPGWEVRNATLKLIAHVRDAARYPRLVEKLGDRREAGIVRRTAAEMLARAGHATSEARAALVAALNDSYWEVRAEAGRALSVLFAAAADLEEALLARLYVSGRNGRRRVREGNFEVRMAIAEALGGLGVSRGAFEALVELAGDGSWLVRSQASVALVQFAARLPDYHAEARQELLVLDRQSEGAVSYFIHREVLSHALRAVRQGPGAVPAEEVRALYLSPKAGWNRVRH